MIYKDPILTSILGKNYNKLWLSWARISSSSVQVNWDRWGLIVVLQRQLPRTILGNYLQLSQSTNYDYLCQLFTTIILNISNLCIECINLFKRWQQGIVIMSHVSLSFVGFYSNYIKELQLMLLWSNMRYQVEIKVDFLQSFSASSLYSWDLVLSQSLIWDKLSNEWSAILVAQWIL